MELFGIASARVLVAERFVERVCVGSAMGRVEHEMLAATGSRLFLDCAHQERADSAAPEALADDERGYLTPRLVALDEVLDVEGGETRDLTVDFRNEREHRRVGGDAREPLGRLLGRRRIAQLAEKRCDRGGVLGLRFAKRYGGGGGRGASGGGPSSSTYVVLLRPHPPP
jgi:hypothetical protein